MAPLRFAAAAAGIALLLTACGNGTAAHHTAASHSTVKTTPYQRYAAALKSQNIKAANKPDADSNAHQFCSGSQSTLNNNVGVDYNMFHSNGSDSDTANADMTALIAAYCPTRTSMLKDAITAEKSEAQLADSQP